MRLASQGFLIKDRWVLAIALLAGLIHGLVYITIVPPWQHYDEPGNFEHAWLIANQNRLPGPSDFNQQMRREVAASMIEVGFFDHLEFHPNLISQIQPVWIGVPQQSDPPLYYVLASLPLRLVRGTDITFQLYVTRLFSLFLFLITILAGWGLVREITSLTHSLRWMAPLSLALLPGFVDIMTAVNSDVGAVVFYSLFLWGGVRLIKRGFSFGGLTFVLICVLASLFTKRTTFIALPLFFLVLWIVISQKYQKKWVLGVSIGLSALGLVALFSWDDAYLWIQIGNQEEATRVRNPEAPLGRAALSTSGRGEIIQFIPIEDSKYLRDAELTLGLWIWSERPTVVRLPEIIADGVRLNPIQEVLVEEQPTFHAFEVRVNPDVARMYIKIRPYGSSTTEFVTVYYDGLVLAEGSRSVESPPVFDDPGGVRGIWDGSPFVNFIRNGSGEQAWFKLRPWFVHLFPDKKLIHSMNMSLASLDFSSTGWYFQETAANMFRTFWGKFGWGQVLLKGSKPYRYLAIVTFVSFAGLFFFLTREKQKVFSSTTFFLSSAMIGVWAIAFWSGVGSLVGQPFYPGARYAFPAMIPTALMLNTGWREWFVWIKSKVDIPEFMAFLIFILSLLVFDCYAILSIMEFYGN